MVTGAIDVVTGAIDVVTGATVTTGATVEIVGKVVTGTFLIVAACQRSFFPIFLQTRGFLVVPAIVPALRQEPLTLAADTWEFVGMNNKTARDTPKILEKHFFIRLILAAAANRLERARRRQSWIKRKVCLFIRH